MFCAVKRVGVPPPDTTGTGIPARAKRPSARSKNSRVVGSRIGKRHEAAELHSRQPGGQARQVEGGLGRLHTGAPEARVALDDEAHIEPVPGAGLRQLARDDLVVEGHRNPRSAPDQRHEAIRLRPAEDVVGQQDVVGDARVDEDLDLAELLARRSPSPPRPSASSRWRGILWVLMWGRLPMPWRARCACTRRILSSMMSTAMVTAGVSRSEASVMSGSSARCNGGR